MTSARQTLTDPDAAPALAPVFSAALSSGIDRAARAATPRHELRRFAAALLTAAALTSVYLLLQAL